MVESHVTSEIRCGVYNKHNVNCAIAFLQIFLAFILKRNAPPLKPWLEVKLASFQKDIRWSLVGFLFDLIGSGLSLVALLFANFCCWIYTNCYCHPVPEQNNGTSNKLNTLSEFLAKNWLERVIAWYAHFLIALVFCCNQCSARHIAW